VIHEQEWIPDTCADPVRADSCILVETWDDAVPDGQRVLTFKARLRSCSRHAGLADLECFLANYDENRRKNVTFTIANQVKAIGLDKFAWNFDGNGVLHVSFAGELTNAQRTAVQNYCDVQFGPGKVVIT